MGANYRLGAYLNKYGIHPFNVLSSCFLFVSLNLVIVGVPTVFIVMNFVPQLLYRVKKREFGGGCFSNGRLNVRKFVGSHTLTLHAFSKQREISWRKATNFKLHCNFGLNLFTFK